MESESINCCNCNSLLDILNNPPCVLNKCNHSICKQCLQNFSTDRQIEDGFLNLTCPVQQCQKNQDVNIDFNSKITSKYQKIFQNLQAQDSSCKKLCCIHNNKKIKFFCEREQVFICSKCVPDHSHNQNVLRPFEKEQLQEYSQFLISQLEITQQQLEIALNNIQAKLLNLRNVKDTSFRQTSDQIKQICEDTEALLRDHLNILNQQSFYRQCLFDQKAFAKSKIINDRIVIENLKNLIPEYKNSKMIYQGSQHGFKTVNFYDQCVNKNPTFFIVKSQEHQQIFGGYTKIPWQRFGGFKKGNGESFLFKLLENKQFKQLKNTDKQSEVYNQDIVADPNQFMICFGHYGNLGISNDCNINQSSSSRLGCGNSYETADGAEPDSEQSNSYLAGQQNFTVEEIEVYLLIN